MKILIAQQNYEEFLFNIMKSNKFILDNWKFIYELVIYHLDLLLPKKLKSMLKLHYTSNYVKSYESLMHLSTSSYINNEPFFEELSNILIKIEILTTIKNIKVFDNLQFDVIKLTNNFTTENIKESICLKRENVRKFFNTKNSDFGEINYEEGDSDKIEVELNHLYKNILDLLEVYYNILLT
jgi:hypothetical protein